MIVGGGDDAVEFSFPKGLLQQHSDFAKAALKEGWRESEEQTVRLEDEKVEIFEIFAEFLYTGHVRSSKAGDTNGEIDAEWVRLPDCWIFGDKFQSSSFKDAVLDTMTRKIIDTQCVPTHLQAPAYDEAAGPNAFRRLVVDIAAFEWGAKRFRGQDVTATWAPEFFRDTCIRLKTKMAGQQAPWINGGCTYHEHGTEKPCYKTMF